MATTITRLPKPANRVEGALQLARFLDDTFRVRVPFDIEATHPGLALLVARCKAIVRAGDDCVTPPQRLWYWREFPTQDLGDLEDAHPDLLIYCNDQDAELARAICAPNLVGTIDGTASEQYDGTIRIVAWVDSFKYSDTGVQLDLFQESTSQ